MTKQSTAARTSRKEVQKREKPAKPYANFPLFAHLSGKWCKVIRGKSYYFGSWADPYAALAEYESVADDLHAGREPRPKSQSDGLTLRELCDAYTRSKKLRVEAGELSQRTFAGYVAICKTLIDAFGRNRVIADLQPDDFERLYQTLSQRYNGAASLGPRIVSVRSVFRYGSENGLLDKPVIFGSTFRPPSRNELRKSKAKRRTGKSKLFEAVELRQLLDVATVPMKAMILLACNGGLGNSDISNLSTTDIDFDGQWLDLPRVKTGIDRHIPLWDETIAAVQAVLKERPDAVDPADADIVFLTRFGQRWVRFDLAEERKYGKVSLSMKSDDAVTKEFAKLLRKRDLKQPGRGFYGIRHTFATVAGGAIDSDAVRHLMGHVDNSMTAHYQHSIEDSRLQAVVNHVHRWLFDDSKSFSEKLQK